MVPLSVLPAYACYTRPVKATQWVLTCRLQALALSTMCRKLNWFYGMEVRVVKEDKISCLSCPCIASNGQKPGFLHQSLQ